MGAINLKINYKSSGEKDYHGGKKTPASEVRRIVNTTLKYVEVNAIWKLLIIDMKLKKMLLEMVFEIPINRHIWV